MLAADVIVFSHLETDIKIKNHHDILNYVVHETVIFNFPVTNLGVQGRTYKRLLIYCAGYESYKSCAVNVIVRNTNFG
jgi:hypothetical protein